MIPDVKSLLKKSSRHLIPKSETTERTRRKFLLKTKSVKVSTFKLIEEDEQALV